MSFKCPHESCNKVYNRRDYLERHELNHRGAASRCPLCDREFARADVLRRHLLRSCKARIGDEEGSATGGHRRTGHDAILDVDEMVPRKRRRKASKSIAADTSSDNKEPDSYEVIEPVSPISIPAPPEDPGSTSVIITETVGLSHANNPFDNAPRTDSSATPFELFPQPGPPPALSNGVTLEGFNTDDLCSWLFSVSAEAPAGPSSVPLDSNNWALPLSTDTSHTASFPTTVLDQATLEPHVRLPQSMDRPLAPQTPLEGAQIRTAEFGQTLPSPLQPFAVIRQPWGHTHYRNLASTWHDTLRDDDLPPPQPVLTEDTRTAMLDLFEPELRNELDCAVFSLNQMSLYLELFFIHFAPLYPIIHRPSLPYRQIPPELLLTMICIGSAFADERAGLRIASKIHKRLRNKILDRVEDDPRVDVSGLQIILLINLFSRTYCSLKEHHVAQIFHSPSISMSRLSGVFLPKLGVPPQTSEVSLSAWLDWVAEEERVRIGWFAFMMDVENAALYRHVLLIHCFKVETEFPVPRPIWEATTPRAWITAWRQSPPVPSFRSSLRTMAGGGAVEDGLSDDCLWIMLHALISISWTLYFRDLGDLSMVHDSKITQWKTHLSTAFGVWVTHVEMLHRKRRQSNSNLADNPVYWIGTCFAHLGQILLYTDTEQIRIFAGASNVAGRSISPGEWAAANMYCSTWAKSQDGAHACYSAVQLLSTAYRWSEGSRYRTAPNVIPWGMYIASLVIWAYATVLDGPDSLIRPYVTKLSPDQLPSPSGSVNIESSLARRDALQYLEGMQSCTHAFGLFEYKEKKHCAGIIAYTAHLVGLLQRGVTDECGKDLVGLLTEHMVP